MAFLRTPHAPLLALCAGRCGVATLQPDRLCLTCAPRTDTTPVPVIRVLDDPAPVPAALPLPERLAVAWRPGVPTRGHVPAAVRAMRRGPMRPRVPGQRTGASPANGPHAGR